MSDEPSTTEVVEDEAANSIAPGSVTENPEGALVERVDALERRLEEMFHMHSPEPPAHPPMAEIGEVQVTEETGSGEHDEHPGRDSNPSGKPWTHRRIFGDDE